MRVSIFTTLATVSLAMLAVAGVLIFSHHSSGKFLAILGVYGVAAATLFNAQLKNLSFTLFVIATVIAAFLMPGLFIEVGGFQMKTLMVPLLQIIMFGMGTAIGWRDFVAIAKSPKPIFLGVSCQFLIMPIVGWLLVSLFQFPVEIAAGVILIGCSPSGLASNVMAYLAKANLALSVSLTIVATLIAPVMTPLLMKVLAGQLVEINFLGMMWSMLKIVILPVVAGILVNHFAKPISGRLNQIMPVISMAGIAFIIGIIIAAGQKNLATIGLLLLFVCLLHNLLGFVLGYGAARMLGLDERSARTVSFEVGMQNGGLASALALQLGKMGTMGLAPAIFSVLMNITGSSLANWWKNKPIRPVNNNKNKERA